MLTSFLWIKVLIFMVFIVLRSPYFLRKLWVLIFFEDCINEQIVHCSAPASCIFLLYSNDDGGDDDDDGGGQDDDDDDASGGQDDTHHSCPTFKIASTDTYNVCSAWEVARIFQFCISANFSLDDLSVFTLNWTTRWYSELCRVSIWEVRWFFQSDWRWKWH